MGHLGTWTTTIRIDIDPDLADDKGEVEVECSGDFYCSGDMGLSVEDFSWKLDGREIAGDAGDSLASLWCLEEVFLEHAHEHAYTQGSVIEGRLYKLGKAGKHLFAQGHPHMVLVLAVSKVPGRFEWAVVAERQGFGMGNPIRLFPVDYFYQPGQDMLPEEDGPFYILADKGADE